LRVFSNLSVNFSVNQYGVFAKQKFFEQQLDAMKDEQDRKLLFLVVEELLPSFEGVRHVLE